MDVSLSGLRNYAPSGLRHLARAFKTSNVKWRYLDNFAPLLRYKFSLQSLTGEAARLSTDLNNNGIAITSAQALLGPNSCYDELKAAVDVLKADSSDAMARAQLSAGTVRDDKSFLLQLLGEPPTLDVNDIFVRFALQRPIIQIVNAYFGMFTQLRYFNVWYNFATQAPPLRSQFWHRDQEDRFIIKVFVYLSDVDDGAGPFTYIPGSHPKKGLARDPEGFFEKNRRNKRSNDEQIAAVVPPEQWIKGIGPEGTIIFADTRGYHKGGLARTRDRILYNCMFVSQAAKCDVSFESPKHAFSA